MSEYEEPEICIDGVPAVQADICPSELLALIPTDLEMSLTMGEYSYYGYLTTDLPDRVKRVAALILGLWKRFNFVVAQFSTTFIHTFKYPRAVKLDEPIPDKIVEGSAFGFVAKMLVEIDTKLNYIVQDLDEIRPVASIPEHWQIRPEANRPIGVFLFGEWEPGDEKIQSPKWQVCVPHFDPLLMGQFDNSFGYTKGSYQFLYTLPDNSKIIFYGNDKAEMEVILERWLTCIPAARRAGGFLKDGSIKGLPFSIRRLRLIRIDYYAQGILKSTPTGYIKFPRRPIEMEP